MKQLELLALPLRESRFDGATFDQARDGNRLSNQLNLVRDLMKDGHWRSLSEISRLTAQPESSISARLRDLRKERFGAMNVERRHMGNGLFEYRIGG